MRLDLIELESYCGARDVCAPLPEPVTLFCGPNGTGKSSIAEGVRFALTGEVTRVSRRKGLDALVTRGAKLGIAKVTYSDEDRQGVAIATVPDGAHKVSGPMLPPAVEYLTDAGAFADMSADERRSFLFELLGVQVTPEAVGALLIKRGCLRDLAEQAAAMVHSGFPAACEYAKDRAKEARGAWRSITGEAYGSKKAEGWAASHGEPYDKAAHLDTIERAGRVQDAYSEALKDVGALEERARQRGLALACPHCGGIVSLQGDKLIEHDGAPDDSADAIEEGQRVLGEYLEEIDRLNGVMNEHEARKYSAETCEKATRAAAAAHVEVAAWAQIAEHLAPDGVPSELLARAIRPFNEALFRNAELAKWERVGITDEMQLVADFPYPQLSESERWRVDALVTVSIAQLSGARFALLDGFDVLDVQGRSHLFNWLERLVRDRAMDSVLLFGTLTNMPAPEPGFFGVYRVEDGVCGRVKL